MAESILGLFLDVGLSPETARHLAGLAKPAVRLAAHKLQDDSAASVGASKLGGNPDLSSGFEWPRWRGQPLAFLAQVNLADVASFPFCSALPDEGVLAFFYDADQGTWGFDPKDRGSWLVHSEPTPAALRRTAPPEVGSAPVYGPCALSPREVITLPPADSLTITNLGLSPEDLDKYYGALERWAEVTGDAEHQLLGHPSPIQGDMQLECQLVSHGLYCGDPSGYEDPRAQALQAGANSWQLLMQIDSDDHAEMMWGDCGRLYFWLTDDALQRKAFDETWMILQCS